MTYTYRVSRDYPASELTDKEKLDIKKNLIQTISSIQVEMLDYTERSDRYIVLSAELMKFQAMLEEING